MNLSSLWAMWRSQGARGSLRVVADVAFARRSRVADDVVAVATGARALEVGGPSRCFRRGGMLPVYPVVAALDVVTFSTATLWEGSVREGSPFAPHGRVLGARIVGEAAGLTEVRAQSYDVVLSSHCLEHCADALGALREWRRVCRPDGYLCLVVPHRDGTFDWRRSVTTLEHYRHDARDEASEHDTTHFEEIVARHDIRRDAGVRSPDELRARLRDNYATRAAHHHVLTTRSALALVGEAGWSAVAVDVRRPYDIVVLAQNRSVVTTRLDPSEALRRSPFASDH